MRRAPTGSSRCLRIRERHAARFCHQFLPRAPIDVLLFERGRRMQALCRFDACPEGTTKGERREPLLPLFAKRRPKNSRSWKSSDLSSHGTTATAPRSATNLAVRVEFFVQSARRCVSGGQHFVQVRSSKETLRSCLSVCRLDCYGDSARQLLRDRYRGKRPSGPSLMKESR